MVFCLCLLFVATIVSGSLFFAFNALKFLKYISVFGGAFLLAVCFVDMLPDVFAQNDNVLLCSAFILIGFLLQLLLELISKGAEHGHLHTDNSKDNPHSHSHLTPIMMLVGVSIHAFFEGFALIGENGINTSLLTGVILHNIPVSVVIVGSFVQSNSSKTRAFCMLSIFAIMGVAGALIGHYSLFVMRYAHIVLSFVVGILLHVSVSTLFDNERSHQYNFIRFLIVIAAFGLVLALP